MHTININIHFQIKLKTSWAPKYLCLTLGLCLECETFIRGVPKKCLTLDLCLECETFIRGVPKKCLILGLCLEYETFIRGVFCPNSVCLERVAF